MYYVLTYFMTVSHINCATAQAVTTLFTIALIFHLNFMPGLAF